MDDCDILTTIDAVEEGEEKLEGIEDCVAAEGGDMTEMFPVSPLKLEEKTSTISVSISTVATTASAADVEHTTTDSTLELDEEVEVEPPGRSVPPLLNSSVDNTSAGDVQQTNIVSVLEDESSGSNSVDVSQETNNDSDSVLTVVLEPESSGSDGVPTSPKSEPNTSADVAQQANKDAPLVLDEELEEKPSTSGSVSIWEKSIVPSTMSVAFKPVVDPNNEGEEEEGKPAAEGNENEALILNDKSLLAQSLIVKLMNLLLGKRLAEVTKIKNKSNSRKRPSSAISEAAASETCGITLEPSTHVPPPHTMTTNCTLMDYYIYKRKQEGKEYNYSQLLIDNSGLEMELNYYTERMKSFIMLPAKHPNKPEETEESNPVKRVREEDETNGAQNSKMTD